MAMPKLSALASVVSVDKIENGAWLHLRSPIDGEPLWLDPAKKTKPMRALVRSYRSRVYRSKDFALQTKANAKARRAKVKDIDSVLEEDVKLERPRKFAVLLVELENADYEQTGSLILSEDDKISMAAEESEFGWLVDQVMDFAFSDENFGPEAKRLAEEEKKLGNVEPVDQED